jgi:hypothetical protein
MGHRRRESDVPSLLLALMLGAALGVIFAPHDLSAEERAELLSRGRTKSKSLARRVLDRLPARIKVAGALGAVKGAGRRAYIDVKGDIRRALERE